MKKIFLLLILILTTSVIYSQAWMKNLPQGKSNKKLSLFDYQKAFYDYWAPFKVDKGFYFENGNKKKAPGWKQFKRWEYQMESQINPTTGAFPEKSAQQVYETYLKTIPKLKSKSISNWTSLGTNSSTGGYAGVGRLNCTAFHPTNLNTYWVGAASGGLWVTTNNGTSWTCLTDNNNALAVSDIVIPSDFATSNTIYIATGDKDHWDNRSVGVLKSTDGGSTWNTTGINYSLASGSMVYRLLLDPNNNQILIAATSNGVFKTTNGGTTWNTLLSTASFIDMEFKPGDFNTLYGATTSGSISISTNGGSTWTQTFSDVNAQRMELAVSPNQSAYLYAVAVNSNSGLYGIYKSTNSGATFTQVFNGTTKNLLGWYDGIPGNDDSGQGWYDLCLAASPSNANTLLVGGINTWRSLDGGASWSMVNHWYGGFGAPAAHADKHTLKFRSNGSLFECNDGGIYISTDNGTSWIDKTNGMVISQMYKLGVSQTLSNEVITGLQDNGTKLLSGGAWYDVKGGDGTESLIDYTDANIQYGTYVNGQIDRTTNHWNSATNIQPSGSGDGAWVTPYIIDPTNPLILYAGYADVWKTIDRGSTWTQISSINASSKIRSMAIAPSNTQVLYVAAPLTIWKTSNGGTSWTDITGTLPSNNGDITSIAVKNDDANTLWVTIGGFNSDKVYQSTNGGTTWTNISAGLPQIPAYSIIQNKQSSPEVQLYLGTELGVYFKKGTDNWVAFNLGLPNVTIGELEIYYASNPQASKLRAATFGRGLWETPVYYTAIPMSYISSTTTQNNIAALAPTLNNQEIIGVQVVVSGSLSPFSATSFTFNTLGSTNPATDISNAKLFYSGLNNSFSTGTQFGSTYISPNGTFIITGTQTLSDGINYFWLTYDVPITATLNNFLDGQCTALTIGTVRTPTISNPIGNRQIAVTYCNAGSNICDEYISNVSIGSINNTSACSTNGYADYTAISTNITQGTSLPINIANPMPYAQDHCGIWVDWNNNGDFTDDLAITVSGSPGGGPYSAIVSCPANALAGLKRMRVRVHYNEEPTSPCGISNYGEVEDYTINVLSSCTPPSAPLIGTILQPTCTTSTGSVQLNGLPSGGSWTLTRTPGGTTTSGAGTSTTISGLSSGTYSFTVTYPALCTSLASANALINTQPSTPAAPTGAALQVFCSNISPTVANLSATGNAIKWYASATGGTALASATTLQNGNHYWATQTISSCESTARLDVTATINTTPAPTANSTQSFNYAASVANLLASGTNLKWYDAPAGGNLLLSTVLLTNAFTYYASQTLSGCESQNRSAVTVSISLYKTVNLHLYLEGLFNKSTSTMIEAMDGNTNQPQWASGIADKIQIDLFQENYPYTPLGVSISGIDLNTNGSATFQISSSHNGNYFMKVSNRNHLATWSAIAIPFNTETVYYNFSSDMLQAFGTDPQMQPVPGKYAFYLGDIDQGGWVDTDDFNLFEPNLILGTTGFLSSDFNGGGWVDSEDFNLFEPRLTSGVTSQYP